MAGRLDGRLALVTGASRGIGRAVARRYAAEGAHVMALARSVPDLESLDDEIRALGGQATLVPMDLADWDAIDGLAAPILERWGRLDILVGNAAIMGTMMPMAQAPPDEWETVFKVNVHANWRLIRALDPLLRAAPAGRALFVTSGITQHLPAYWGAYAMAKAALEAMIVTYAKEVASSSLRVNLINPGPTRTALRAAAFPGEDPNSLPAPEDAGDAFVAAVSPDFLSHGSWIAADEWDPAANPTVQ